MNNYSQQTQDTKASKLSVISIYKDNLKTNKLHPFLHYSTKTFNQSIIYNSNLYYVSNKPVIFKFHASYYQRFKKKYIQAHEVY